VARAARVARVARAAGTAAGVGSAGRPHAAGSRATVDVGRARVTAPDRVSPREILEAIRRKDGASVASAVRHAPDLAEKPQVVLAAARAGDPAILATLDRAGADWNARWRGYRPLHSLIQEDATEDGAPSRDRLASLHFLLARGAQPEALGAFPPARAVIVAAMTGVPS
jgi:hypothetical protein